MKKFIILILILAAGGYFYQHRKPAAESTSFSPIEKPFYTEARVKMNIQGHELEALLISEAADELDCMKQRDAAEKYMKQAMASLCHNNCALEHVVCKPELEVRYAKLFNNEPTFLTYMRLARGTKDEREMRIIYWGLTVAQSDTICDAVPQFQKGRKGTVSCIRAAR